MEGSHEMWNCYAFYILVSFSQNGHFWGCKILSRKYPINLISSVVAFCKSTSHIPANNPHPQHPTSRTSHIPSNPHPHHPTSPTSHISINPHPQHPTSPTSHILNITHPQHTISPTFHIWATIEVKYTFFYRMDCWYLWERLSEKNNEV